MKVVAILFAALLGASPALAGALFRCDWIEINDANKMCKDKNVNGYVHAPGTCCINDAIAGQVKNYMDACRNKKAYPEILSACSGPN